MRHSDVAMDERVQEHLGSPATAVLTADKGTSAPSRRAPGGSATANGGHGAHCAAEGMVHAEWRVTGGG